MDRQLIDNNKLNTSIILLRESKMEWAQKNNKTLKKIYISKNECSN